MVELLGEGCFMKKKKNKMLKMIKSKHHRRHGHGLKHREGLVCCGALAGHPGGIIGGVDHIVVVLRGSHHHHHHRHAGGEDHGHHHHRKGHGHGHGPIEAGLKHRGGRHHHRCCGLGLIFQHQAGGEGSGADGEQQAIEAAPVTPTVPQAEAMMNNLTLEAN